MATLHTLPRLYIRGEVICSVTTRRLVLQHVAYTYVVVNINHLHWSQAVLITYVHTYIQVLLVLSLLVFKMIS